MNFFFILLLSFFFERLSAFHASSDTSARNFSIAASSNNDDIKNVNNKKKIGFIGFGTIASAIANGILLNNDDDDFNNDIEINISERSIVKSKALKEKFPDIVTVYKDNSMIVEQSDVIYLCVLPQQAQTVLQDLNFESSRHQLISLVSTATLKDLSLYSKLPESNVAKVICLPAVTRHQGVALYCSVNVPTDDEIATIPGEIMYCKDEDQLSASMITTCTMGPFYGLLRRQREWLIEKGGLSKRDASNLVIRQHLAMIQDALREENDDILDDLIDEQTPGGLNEQSLANWEKLDGLNSYDQAMDAVLRRIRGESDGSL